MAVLNISVMKIKADLNKCSLILLHFRIVFYNFISYVLLNIVI